MTKENRGPILSRPEDKTWQSFRSWLLSTTSFILGRPAKDNHTPEEWQQLAEKFWSAGKDKNG
jgi:hypothetical protein